MDLPVQTEDYLTNLTDCPVDDYWAYLSRQMTTWLTWQIVQLTINGPTCPDRWPLDLPARSLIWWLPVMDLPIQTDDHLTNHARFSWKNDPLIFQPGTRYQDLIDADPNITYCSLKVFLAAVDQLNLPDIYAHICRHLLAYLPGSPDRCRSRGVQPSCCPYPHMRNSS